MNRGSRQKRAQKRPAQTTFNEAPIHESGKSNYVVVVQREDLAFNEAPIHESGK